MNIESIIPSEKLLSPLCKLVIMEIKSKFSSLVSQIFDKNIFIFF